MYTNKQKSACAFQEWEMRKRIYPRLVKNNRISSAMAEEELGMIREIGEEYGALASDDMETRDEDEEESSFEPCG